MYNIPPTEVNLYTSKNWKLKDNDLCKYCNQAGNIEQLFNYNSSTIILVIC